MKAEIVNKKALEYLSQKNWKEAQALFFENVKNNPSHKTYNNLGNYLVDEGLLCENGSIINANKLGLKYLFMALEKELSSKTINAIIKAYDHEIRTSIGEQKKDLLVLSRKILERAQNSTVTKENRYNYLRVRCLLGDNDSKLLSDVRKLVKEYVCEETVSLYLHLLTKHALINEGIRCIEYYNYYLDELDCLMFFAKLGLYEEGALLCDSIKNNYFQDKYIMSAVIECYTNIRQYEEVKRYIDLVREDNLSYEREEKMEFLLEDLFVSTNLRKKTILEYEMIPPLIKTCCYYGCPIHGTKW